MNKTISSHHNENERNKRASKLFKTEQNEEPKNKNIKISGTNDDNFLLTQGNNPQANTIGPSKTNNNNNYDDFNHTEDINEKEENDIKST